MQDGPRERRPPCSRSPTPPHSPGTEQAILGATLIHEGTFPDLAEGLDLVDFFEECHQVLWRVMSDLHAAGSPIDLRTVQAALEDRGPPPLPTEVLPCHFVLGGEGRTPWKSA